LDEAMDIFPEERIKEACGEMLDRGLLRVHGEGFYEMHETIRAGLEDLLPSALKRNVHRTLSNYYLSTHNVVPAVFHLNCAGDEPRANALAKQSFLEGRHRAELAVYVGEKRLLAWEDLEAWVTGETLPEEFYVLPGVIRDLN